MLLLAACLAELGRYFHWKRRAQCAAQRGEFLPVGGARINRAIWFAALADLAYWAVSAIFFGNSQKRWVVGIIAIYIFVLLAAVNFIKQFLKRWKAPREVNRNVTIFSACALSFLLLAAVTFGISQGAVHGTFGLEFRIEEQAGNRLPLLIGDLQNVDDTDYTREYDAQQSLLLGQMSVRQYPKLETAREDEALQIDYTVTTIKQPFLYGFCRRSLLRKYSRLEDESTPGKRKDGYQKQDASQWGAQEAYRLKRKGADFAYEQYLLCYPDRIVEASFTWELTDAQKAVAGERLEKADISNYGF